ncbi:MAG: hypothetical protein MJY89_02965 [Bacteroidales bacterium]|nr:hypothetical protein [Bacteroidales bacterium]
MNRYFILFISLFFLFLPAFAQDEETFSTVQALPSDDTESYVDSLLVGRGVFDVMPSGIIINQSRAVRSALERQIAENAGKKFNGFRVRIFLSSAQDARDASARALNLFSRLYPEVPAYRVYDSPNFRVTVGNFRTRLEADMFARSVRSVFPSASVMRERFKYPSIGRANTTARDTVSLDLPIEE